MKSLIPRPNRSWPRPTERWRWPIIAAVVVLALIAYSNVQSGLSNSVTGELPLPTPTEEPRSVTSRATLLPIQRSTLSFRAGGRLAEVSVKPGDKVRTGQVLARLQAPDLEMQLRTAQDNLALNQALLAQVKAGPRPQDLIAAEASVRAAQTTYNKLLNGPSEADISAAESNVAAARAALQRAKSELARLKSSPTKADLQLAAGNVTSAQSALKQAESRLSALKAGPRPSEIRAAELALEQARNTLWATQIERDGLKGNKALPKYQGQAADARVAAAETAVTIAQADLDALLAGPSAEELTIAEQAVISAQAALTSAQAQQARVKAGPTPEELAAAEASVSSATAALQAQEAQLAKLKAGPSEEELAIAASNLANAQARLEVLRAGPSEEELNVAQARVRQAETLVEQARQALEYRTIVAPFDCTVTEISANVGEHVSLGQPVVKVADFSKLKVETTDLDEAGATRVRLGQTVSLSLNAFDDKVITGKVVAIAPEATYTSIGDANYTVTIELEAQDPELWPGMTAKADFGSY